MSPFWYPICPHLGIPLTPKSLSVILCMTDQEKEGEFMDRPVYQPKKRLKVTTNYTELINPETGEVLLVEDNVETPRYHKFVRIKTSDLYRAAMELDSNAFKILSFIMDNMSFGTNTCTFTYRDLVDELHLGKNTVTRAMVDLQEKDYIRMFRVAQWMLNPYFAVGCQEDYRTALIKRYFNLPTISERRNKKEKGEEDDAVE